MTPNKNFVRVLKRLYHILRQWDAQVWISHNCLEHDLWPNSIKFRISGKVYGAGIYVRELSKYTVGKYLNDTYIKDPKLTHRAQAFINVLDEFFRDTDLRITDTTGAWSIRGTTYVGNFHVLLSAASVKDLITLYTDTCDKASDMVLEFSELMKKHKAHITWDARSTPYYVPAYFMVLSVGTAPADYIPCCSRISASVFDPEVRSVLKEQGTSDGALAFLEELYLFMHKYNMSIGRADNNLYMGTNNILVCDSLMAIDWYHLHSAWQHKGLI